MNDEEFLHSGRRVRSADAAVFKAVEHEAALERKAQRAEHQELNLVPRQYQRPEENKVPGHQQPEAVKSPRTSEVRTPRISPDQMPRHTADQRPRHTGPRRRSSLLQI